MAKDYFIIPIFVPHEGCPHNCIFCNQNSITGSSEVVNAEFVRQTIDEYLKTIPKSGCTVEVSFFGGTFTAIAISKQKELLSVAKEYKALKKIENIRLSTRPDYIDTEILDNLKEYDVDIIELGVQSLDDEVLMKSARGHNEDDVIKASMLIKKYGFILGHQIMIGLPGDNLEKDINTTEKLIKLKPDLARIYPALVIKNTPMEKMLEQNLFVPYTLEQAVNISKIIYSRLSSEGINVIRIGLQTTEAINVGKDIISGPFHPAFRELVEGSIINDMIIDSIPIEYSGEIKLMINSKDLSKLYCHKKKYFVDTKEQLSSISMIVVQDNNVEKGSIKLVMSSNTLELSISEYMARKYAEGK